MWDETTAFVTYLTIAVICMLGVPLAIGSLVCTAFGNNPACIAVIMSIPIGIWVGLKMSKWFLDGIKITYGEFGSSTSVGYSHTVGISSSYHLD